MNIAELKNEFTLPNIINIFDDVWQCEDCGAFSTNIYDIIHHDGCCEILPEQENIKETNK